MIDTRLLRQKILDLAIRGKLVPQNPNDEPASELLKKIKAEKEALIKAGKLKRDKHESFIFRGDDKRYYEQIDGRTADITGEIPFDLPAGWEWCRLQSIASKITDGEHNTPQREKIFSGYYLLSARNILDSGLDLSRVDFVSQETYKVLSARCGPQINDVLLSCSGSVGRCCICSKSNCVLVRSVALIAPSIISSLFLQYAIQSNIIQKQIQAKQKQVAQANIFQTEIKALFLPLPPLAEQQRIVAQIESLLKCVGEIDRESATLEKSLTLAKQKILALAIRGKLVPQDPKDEPASELLKKIKAEKEAQIKAGKMKRDKHESFIFRGDDNCYYWNIEGKRSPTPIKFPFRIPHNWVWVNLGDIMDIARGGSPRPIESYLTDSPEGYNWIKIGDVAPGSKFITSTKEKIRPEGLSKTRYVEIGDFLLSNSMSFGRPYILKINGCIHDGWLVLHPLPGSVNADFLFYALSSTSLYELLRQAASGSTVKNLKSDTVKQLLFPLPPYNEQGKIALCLQKTLDLLTPLTKLS